MDLMNDWLHAPDIPEELEGKLAWEWHGGEVEYSRIPSGYDRRRVACGGFYYKLIHRPFPPDVK